MQNLPPNLPDEPPIAPAQTDGEEGSAEEPLEELDPTGS